MSDAEGNGHDHEEDDAGEVTDEIDRRIRRLVDKRNGAVISALSGLRDQLRVTSESLTEAYGGVTEYLQDFRADVDAKHAAAMSAIEAVAKEVRKPRRRSPKRGRR